MLPLLAVFLQAPQSFLTTDLSGSPKAVLRPVPAGDVKLLPGFWLDRVRTNRNSLRAGHEQLEKIGAFENFAVAAGRKEGQHQVYVFTDSDAYKWLEAACIEIALRGGDEELRRQVDEFVPLILAAMEPDGYVMTKYTIEKLPRWQNLANDHELYCMGHLIQAAIAHRRAFGDSAFFARVRGTADMIGKTFPGQREGACGHPEIEIALVELYRETGDKHYLDTATYFINRRGVEPKVAGGSEYMQDHKPFREQREAVGHAVRALYLYTGAADVYLESGDETLPPVLTDLWNDLHYYKTYVTGGVGARHDGEAIGARYELPNKEAYSETCAAIASVLFSQRMLCMTGDARYGDAMETALYNNILAAVSLDGTKFFYVNPLESDGGHERKDWYACACCPPNIMRTIANIGGYFFLAKENTLYVNLYGACELDTVLPGGRRAHLRVETTYPWELGAIVELLEGNEVRDFRFRNPGWSRYTFAGFGVPGGDGFMSVDPQDPKWLSAENPSGGCYVYLQTRASDSSSDARERSSVEVLAANPALAECRNKIALRRGPIIYCFESDETAPWPIQNYELLLDREQAGLGFKVELKADILGAIMAIQVPARHQSSELPSTPKLFQGAPPLYQPLPASAVIRHEKNLVAIPYYAWANRGNSQMQVWMPVAQ